MGKKRKKNRRLKLLGFTEVRVCNVPCDWLYETQINYKIGTDELLCARF